MLAPKCSTIARANVGPMPGTRRRSQSATPSGVCGSVERNDCDGELPAVARVLLEGAGDDEAVARGDVAERVRAA